MIDFSDIVSAKNMRFCIVAGTWLKIFPNIAPLLLAPIGSPYYY